jgi:hypothetical protein
MFVATYAPIGGSGHEDRRPRTRIGGDPRFEQGRTADLQKAKEESPMKEGTIELQDDTRGPPATKTRSLHDNSRQLRGAESRWQTAACRRDLGDCARPRPSARRYALHGAVA